MKLKTFNMANTEQRPSGAPRTATNPSPGQGNNRGTGPRTPNNK